tara:strand:+ start:246 stop:446 length:201 start_codon:yes stop_codon:yes gene_type:complete
MNKPANYKELNVPELHKVARALLMWNCNQPVSDAKHNKHYNAEIQPLHDCIDELNSVWINKYKAAI